MKRLFDIITSGFGLLFACPVLLPVIFLVWMHDHFSPFYVAARVGRNGNLFNMIKLRSMIHNADRCGVDSTSNNDDRITPVGHFIRRYKLDELAQLWNVLWGDMSMVGPRPNVKKETDLYTNIEKKLLTVRPGITDFSSIVFSDEGDILEGMDAPDIAYNQLIRPWKSRLGIVYIENRSLLLDVQLLLITVIAIFSRNMALRWVVGKLVALDADPKLIQVATRQDELEAYPPPGADDIVTSRES